MKNIFKRAAALMLSLLMVFSVCSTSLVIYAQEMTTVPGGPGTVGIDWGNFDLDDLKYKFGDLTSLDNLASLAEAVKEEVMSSGNATEQITIIQNVYEELQKDTSIIPADSQIKAAGDLFMDLTTETEGEKLLTDEQAAAILGSALEVVGSDSGSGSGSGSAIDKVAVLEKVTETVIEQIITNPEVSQEKFDKIMDKVNENLGGSEGGTGSTGGTIIPAIPTIPNEIVVVKGIINTLVKEGLLTEAQAKALVSELMNVVLESEGSTDYEALIHKLYGIVYTQGFEAKKTAKIVYVVVECLVNDGILDAKINTYVEPYYQIAINYVLTTENINAANYYIDLMIKAVSKVSAVVDGYATTTPELIGAKEALVAELNETLTTLGVAKDILANNRLADAKTALQTILSLKGDAVRHARNIVTLAKELGIAGDYAINELKIAAQEYESFADYVTTTAYEWIVENVKDKSYFEVFEKISAALNKFDPALAQAVSTFMHDAPADTLALIFIYGEDAVYELGSVAVGSAKKLYDAAANFAYILKDHGVVICRAILNDSDCRALKSQIKTDSVAFAKKFYKEAIEAVKNADPTVGEAFESAIQALLDAAGSTIGEAGGYAEWLTGKAGELASKIVDTFVENWNELADIAGSIVYNKVMDIFESLTNPETVKTILDKIAEEAVKVAPQLDAKLYAYLNSKNPEFVAFVERHESYLNGLAERYGEEALGTIGVALATYGTELGEYLVENADEILAGIVEFVEENNVQIVALLQIYAEYLGICDDVSGEINVLSQKLAKLQAEITKWLDIINNDIIPELGELGEQLKTATEPAKAAIMQKIEALNQKKQQLEQYIAEVQVAMVEIRETIAELNQKQQALNVALDNLGSALETLANVGVENGIGGVLEALNAAAYAIRDLVNVLDGNLAEKIDDLIKQVREYLENAYNSAVEAEYNINAGSKYVAFGDNKAAAAAFAALLKGEVTGVGYTYPDAKVFADSKITDLFNILSSEDGVKAVAGADLISIGYSYDQIAEDTIYTLIDLLIFGKAQGEVELPTAEDWKKLVGTQVANEVIALLAEIEKELIANGLNTSIAPYLAKLDADLADEAAKNGKTISEAAMTVLEYFAYNAVEYAVLVPQAIEMINQINPDALVILNAISNPVSGWSITYDELEINIGDYIDYVVDIIYVESVALAATNDSVVFAATTNVETSFTGMGTADTLKNLLMYLSDKNPVKYEITPAASAAEYIATAMKNALVITVDDGILGDVNSDGYVDTLDVMYYKWYLVKMIDENEIDLTVADVDGNGECDSLDVMYICWYLVKMITEFPAE